MLPEHQVQVEALEDGRWAQEPWKPQLQVTKGDRVILSISFATRLSDAKLCRILDKNPLEMAKQVKAKDESDPAVKDKKAAKGK